MNQGGAWPHPHAARRGATSIAPALVACLPFVLHGAAREVDRAVGLLLHTSLDLPDFVPLALGLVDPARLVATLAAWGACGVSAVVTLVVLQQRALGLERRDAVRATALLVTPLLLRPALSLIALAALALQPAYPYGFTLAVALTQDWGFAQDAAAAAALVAGLVPLARASRGWPRALPGPRTGDVFLLAFLAYGLLTPDGARRFDAHPGNEPKYLRMAVALAHGLTLDVDTLVAPMEELPVTPLSVSLPRAARRAGDEAARLLAALAAGHASWTPHEARADAHLTVRARDGGAYHVLAPGPSVLLAPALRLERAWNHARGTPGRLGITLLLWNLLAAGVVAATFALARDVARSTGAALVVAGAVALTPPLLFYSFQFYPEVPAALLLAWGVRRLALGHALDTRACLGLGLAVAALPWLHQKYMPLAAALALWALVAAVDPLARARALAALALPPLVSAALVALYNFALTGSPRPDALFRALGREGVSLAHFGQGALGLACDARYGLLPYVPFLLLAGAGLWHAPTRVLRAAAPVAAVYYATVAAAENWTGSISNLGRFLLPLIPLAAACAAPALRAVARPAALALVLMLAAWSARLATLLWADPLAANDSGLLLAQSIFADGNVYLPTLLLSSWSEAHPALAAQLACGALLAALVAFTLRPSTGRPPASAARALALGALALLAVGLALERWPARRGRARYTQALQWDAESSLFVAGAAQVAGDTVHAQAGQLELLLRSPSPYGTLRWRLKGPARVSVDGRPATMLLAGDELAAPLIPVVELRGRRGRAETLARQSLRVDRPVVLSPLRDASSAVVRSEHKSN